MKILNHKKIFLTLIVSFLMIHSAFANWIFDGNLIIPPSCEIGHEKPIVISFGEIGVKKVNGSNFEKDIDYDFECIKNHKHDWDISLYFNGVFAGNGFDDATLQTLSPASPENNHNLGLQIKANGKPLRLNEPFPIVDTNNPPTLSVVPVKRAGVELIGGDFSATGTLVIEFK